MARKRVRAELFFVEPEFAPTIREVLGLLRKSVHRTTQPVTRGHGSAGFRRHGNAWRLAFNGTGHLFPDRVGFTYLAALLKQPHVPVTVLALDRRNFSAEAIRVMALNEPIADEQARTEYRTKLRELEEDLADAESAGDPERQLILREDRNELLKHLHSVEGLAGRPRRVGGESEKSRLRVCRAIRRAIDEIAKANPELGQHLRASTQLGRTCTYRPDRDLKWKL